jgi:transmembrane sensor
MTLNRDEMRLAEEAAKWADRRRREPAEASAEFVAWLRLNPRHIDEYLLSQAIVEVLAQVPLRRLDVDQLASASAPIREIGPDSNEAHRHGADLKRGQRPGFFRPLRVAAAFAASLVIVALVTLWLSTSDRTYSTGLGEQRTVRLDDGSLLELNAESAARVRFSRSVRRVDLLKGEAMFVVAHNVARPFRVWTNNAVVQAVGTQFDVYRRDGDAAQVAVVEGRVAVFKEEKRPAGGDAGMKRGGSGAPAAAEHTDASNPTLLAAGEEAQITVDGHVIKTAQPDVSNAVAWRQRRIVFNSVTLAEAVKEFARYSDFRIQIEGDALAKRRIRGSFHADEPQALLALFTGDNSVEIIHVDNGVIIKAR